LLQIGVSPILSPMAKQSPAWSSISIALLAISLGCLSAPAQGPVGDNRMYFPPVPQQPNYPKQKKTPAKRGNTEPLKSSPIPQDTTTLQAGLLSAVDQSQLQPDPNLGLMKLDVVVTDQQGKSIADLGKNEFTLLDNGQPRNIVTFQAFDNAASKPDPPVEIILVIDELDLPPVLLGPVEQAAQKFLLQNGGHLAQPVKIYRIGSDGLFTSAVPTADGNALAKEVGERKELRTVWRAVDIAGSFQWDRYGSTPITQRSFFNAGWSELPHSLIALGSIAIEERRTPERKLLFWFGSGWPINQKRWQHLFDTVTELSTRLREARIGLWVADFWRQPGQDAFPYQNFLEGVTSEESLAFGNVALQVLAVQSGGGVLKGEGDAADLISRQVAQANSFYTITFDPLRTQTVDEYHNLKVEIGRPGLNADTRTGYYDEPAYYDQARTDAKDVTAAQLRESMTELQHASDSEAERQLNGMELTERLSSANLAEWLATLKGKKSRSALTALADQSVFLPPPAEDTVSRAPPNIADQEKIIQKAITYVSKLTAILPNLSTERTTTLFIEPPRAEGQTWKTAAGDHFLEPVSVAKAAVNVSKGDEAVREISFSALRQTHENRSLQTEGTFGPILASVLIAVAKPQSRLIWARWEKGDSRPLAVFRYFISKDTPIFHVGFCCLAVDFSRTSFETNAPTYGEITVNPASGAILRLTIRADLSWRLPLQRSDIMVEYGPVILGGETYICPIRGVSISRQRTVVEETEYGEKFKVYAPFETLLNDVSYKDYHLFLSTSRMLPGFSEPPGNK
jgi:VWFA-related protein